MSPIGIADPGAFCGTELTLLNRCRARGIACREEAGTFLLGGGDPETLAALGVTARRQAGGAVLDLSRRARVAIYAGAAIGYPYWAYYAHALLAIGLTFVPLSAEHVAAGRLDEFDALVLPGGFATWGLDRAEGIAGVDAAIRAFIAAGGVLLGSCGGAFYVSEGRPGWLGIVDATPKFTQEYLVTGTALVSVSLDGDELARGLPEAVEMPYYHGPVFDARSRRAMTRGRFRTYIQPNRLFIDNPLDKDLFRAEMQNMPAILQASHGKGAVLVFSPHPEMGEFVRKGIILESYVRPFLPVRGHDVMDQTLRFLARDDSAGFRLIHNAFGVLGLFEAAGGEGERRVAAPSDEAGDEAGALLAALATVDEALAGIDRAIDGQVATEAPAMQALLAAEFTRRRTEWDKVLPALRQAIAQGPLPADLSVGLTAALHDAATSLSRSGKLAQSGKLAENLVLTEMPVRLAASALRLILCDRALKVE